MSCTRSGRPIFSGLSFTLAAGEILYVRGPNGAGKTSLLRMIAGLSQPERGTLTLNSAVTFCPATPPLNPQLSLKEQLLYWHLLGYACATPADPLDLGPLLERPLRTLSRGQQQRVGFAPLMNGGKLWLLDEPFAHLDTLYRGRIEDMIRAHQTRGGAVIIADHASPPGATTLDIRPYAALLNGDDSWL